MNQCVKEYEYEEGSLPGAYQIIIYGFHEGTRYVEERFHAPTLREAHQRMEARGYKITHIQAPQSCT